MTQVRTRFAPSPTGWLHIGGLRTALYAYLYAKKNNGKFILRIEDTDQTREVAGATEVIISTMRETGLIYDEGPDIGGPYAPYVQSQRKNDYMKYALQLIQQGDAYYCFCDKERLESLTDENGARKYDKHCLTLSKEEINKKLASGVPYVIRQNIPKGKISSYHDCVYGEISIDTADLEDQILIKSDGMPTYNFANVIDDHSMNITVVMRGVEYLSSTPKYNLLYDALGWERPLYIHMPTIMRDATHKLSKRDGAASYADFTSQGFLKEAILNYIALLGWSPKNNREKLSMDEMLELFSVEGISKSPAIFDQVKMAWLNGQYIKELSQEEFLRLATPWLDKSLIAGKYDYAKLCNLIQGRIEILSEIPDKVNFLEEFTKYDVNLFEHQKQKSSPEIARQILPKVAEILSEVSLWTNDNLYTVLCVLAENLAVKKTQVLYPTRVAISGKESTPGGATELAELLGKEETLRRLNFSISLLNE